MDSLLVSKCKFRQRERFILVQTPFFFPSALKKKVYYVVIRPHEHGLTSQLPFDLCSHCSTNRLASGRCTMAALCLSDFQHFLFSALKMSTWHLGVCDLEV